MGPEKGPGVSTCHPGGEGATRPGKGLRGQCKVKQGHGGWGGVWEGP